MKYLPRAEIERRAEDLLEDKSALKIPVDVAGIARQLGLQVEYVELGDDVSGLLVMNKEHGVVGVNASHPLVRQRFSLAHEIGHFVLHRTHSDLFIDKRYTAVFRNRRSASGEERQEIQANQFAASLLMPSTLVLERAHDTAFDLGDEQALHQLANDFQVSTQAMVFRLTNLDKSSHKATP